MKAGIKKRPLNNVEKAIMRVVAFLDLFDHPLTAREVWCYMDIPGLPLREVWNFLDNGMDTLECREGFYFLKGREETVDIRKRRFNSTCDKLKKATRVAKIFSFFPWIKMIAVSNIIGSYNLRKEGDIDLLIITKKNRVWISRFFCVVTAMIFGWRPKPGKEQDKICLNFFLSEDAYNLEILRCDDEDIYLVFWLVGLFPVYNINYTYEKFIKANDWIKDRLPNWRLKIRGSEYYREKQALSGYFFKFIFSKWEEVVRRLQLWILPAQLKEMMNKDTRVIVNKKMIKLHSKDRRLIFQEKFRRNYQKSLDLLR